MLILSLTSFVYSPILPPAFSPPFPTRRSSDLAIGCDRRIVRHVLRLEGRDRKPAPPRRPAEPRDQHRLADIRARALDHQGADRKSTRLNSSHVAISYAVFCLKKKIIVLVRFLL